MSITENTETAAIGGEARDTERAIALWRERAARFRGIPAITAFDFTSIGGNLGYRFVISCDEIIEDATFLLYGTQFARRLGLPDKTDSFTPLLRQLPDRYRPLFSEGCTEAICAKEPAQFSGSVSNSNALELYRAVFIPVKLRESSSRPIVYGSFNFRRVPQNAVANERLLPAEISDEVAAHQG